MGMNLNAQGYGTVAVDTGATTINDASNWIQVGGAPIVLGGGKLAALLTLICGAGGALAHFKLTRADTIGGTHVDWLVDADLNTATDEMLDCTVPGVSPPNIYQLAAGSKGQIKLEKLQGVAEIGVWAKKATTDTTLEVTGSFHGV
jgi:hypothetical protein